ncbi:MAG: hypothetical protein IH586_14785 [Anaerolineaceae bacterium]|nr:hypothetical protein [Anaerolineaceae bacterium]
MLISISAAAHLEALRWNNIHVGGLAEAAADLVEKKAVEVGIEKAYASFEALLALVACEAIEKSAKEEHWVKINRWRIACSHKPHYGRQSPG